MLVRISSKGQLVIPKAIRRALGLRPGTELHIELVGRKIVLEPVEPLSPIDALYGRYPDADFLTDLEIEHRQELHDDDAFAAALADELGAILVTGDPELAQLEDGIKLEKLTRAKRS
jgi:AbrB family looped-hinge helix DNA binding protein